MRGSYFSRGSGENIFSYRQLKKQDRQTLASDDTEQSHKFLGKAMIHNIFKSLNIWLSPNCAPSSITEPQFGFHGRPIT